MIWPARLVRTVMRFCTSAACALACLHATADAVDLHNVLTGYAIARWEVNDGAPDGSVYALAQDASGYLWLGSDAGLHRFDGMRFIPWDVLSSQRIGEGPVQALHASADGSLWAGFARGGVSRVRGSDVYTYGERDGLPAAAVITIVQDRSGTMWLGGDAGLFFLDGNRWTRWPVSAGLPDGTVWAAHVDVGGTLYVTTPHGLYRRLRGAPRFEQVASLGGVPSPSLDGTASRIGFPPDALARAIATDSAGRVFLSDLGIGFRPVPGNGRGDSEHRGRGLQLLFDRSGHLWVGTSGQGVWRVSQPAASADQVIERVTALTGLAAEGAYSFLEDREGNIWAGGTPYGLTRLTPHRFVPVRHDEVTRALAVTPEGRLWIGTSDSLIEVVEPDRRPTLQRHHLAGSSIHALHVDSSGTLWVATRGDLFRVDPRQSQVKRVSGREQLRQIDSITSDAGRGLLLSDVDRGLLRWTEEGGFAPVALPDKLQQRRILTIHADRRGRLWIAFATGGLAVLGPGDHLEELNREAGFDAGEYRIVHEDPDGVIWLGGAGGITRYEDGRVLTVHADDRLPVRAVRAIAHDGFGYLWIGTSSGFVRVQRDALRTSPAASSHPAYTVYDKSDGLAGLPALRSDATAVRTNGGALWFVTEEGVSVVQTHPPDDNHASRPISIVSVSVDDRQVAPVSGVALPAATRRLLIDYTALNLTSPQKTRFRFRLDGIDSDWIEAGSRRQATYTNLGPGTYRFRVAATIAPGIWEDPPGGWEFSIRPHFYASWWFLGTCGALVPLAVWAGWTVRLRQERIRFSLVLAERARLSREIHDTLLQGLVGVGLQCDALAGDLEGAAPQIQDRFVRLRQQTKRYIKEAREAIWHLRVSPHEREDLVGALQRLGEQIAAPRLAFSTTVKGAPRALDLEVEQQVVRIAHEALTNVVLHAGATHVQIDVEYGSTAMLLRVVDDGCGFRDPAVAGVDGHYGIVSMRERAEAVNGNFRLETGARSGTRIEVTVPFALHNLSVAAT